MSKKTAGRPKADRTRSDVLKLRTFPEIKNAVEDYARQEHRSPSQMTELLLREAITARRKRDKKSTKDIDDLP